MPRHRRATSNASASTTTTARDAPHSSPLSAAAADRGIPDGQEMGSMYDYLAKIILVGPSGCGKSCLLHRFVKGEWRVLTSQTIGVEFASKIVKVGDGGDGGPGGPGGGRRKRIKLQLWDTAGTERFRSVSRSYYRGAAGAVLVYDVCNARSFADLGTFWTDARALASPRLTAVLVGNKADLVEDAYPGRLAEEQQQQQQQGGPRTGKLIDDEDGVGSLSSAAAAGGGSLSRSGTLNLGLGSQLRATTREAMAGAGRAVPGSTAGAWAAQHRIPAAMEVSALSGDNVDEVFHKLARSILTKIELGEIDPDDPMSGIQYGDADYYRYDDGGSSIKSGTGLTSDGFGSGRRKRRGGWGDVFRLGRKGSAGRGRGGCC